MNKTNVMVTNYGIGILLKKNTNLKLQTITLIQNATNSLHMRYNHFIQINSISSKLTHFHPRIKISVSIDISVLEFYGYIEDISMDIFFFNLYIKTLSY